MTIGIDAREICDQPAGKGQYLLRLIGQWRQDADLKLILYTQEGQRLPTGLEGSRLSHRQTPGRGLLWHRAVGQRLTKDGVQVFFAALSYQSALWNRVPTVTVVHDLAIFRLPGLAHNRKAQLVERLTLRRCCKASARLIAVSNSTKHDLVSLIGVPVSQIEVAYEASMLGVQEITAPLPRSAREPFLLFTGTIEPRKNIGALLAAYAGLSAEHRSAYRLKLAGKAGWGGQDYPAMAARLGIGDNVDFLGYVADTELRELFRVATLFLFPSLYEGFGLPVIEAMSAGTPVITSSTSSLPELVGPDGVVCDPGDVQGLSHAIGYLLSDTAAYERQSRYLFSRSRQFSWPEIASQVLGILDQACLK